MDNNNRHFIKSDGGDPIIIRNKKRIVNQNAAPKQETYIPEYKRLDVEPKVYSHNKDDFRMYTPKKRQVLPQVEEQNIRQRAHPFVHSGQNSDWVKENNISEEEAYNDPIRYDDVSLPDEEFEDDINDDIVNGMSQNNEFSLLDIQPGQYVLLCENDVIQYGTLQEIEAAVEHLLLSNDSGEELYGKLFVFKRMGIRTGVFVDNT